MANPNKNKPILDILIKNQEKLVVFLNNFHNDRQGKKDKKKKNGKEKRDKKMSLIYIYIYIY